MNPKDLSSRYQPDLDTELRSMIGDSSLPLYHMMRYHLGWVDASGQARPAKGGKLLRPSLCLYSCESVKGDWRVALPAAAAVELLHNFTLIHDDIEDGDHERRGIPTVWHIWGQPQAINAGDAMHILARLALLKLEEKRVSAEKVIRAARLLDETCLRLCEGQYLDISYEERLDIGIDEYLEMISGKTAALFECSLKLGAMLGTDDEETIEHLGQFARNLGLAFQVQDDVLGIWGKTSVTGKSSATDIMKKKKTLPIVYGMEKADADQRASLLRIYGQELIAESDVPDVLNILDGLNARQYAGDVVRQYCEKAMEKLDQARIFSGAKNDLTLLTESMIGREY
jgi:geranylgeranyl diphosphate synthase, type I